MKREHSLSFHHCVRFLIPSFYLSSQKMVSISPGVHQPSSDQRAMRDLTEEEVPPWKRAEKPFRSKEEAVATFYDSLSKLCLTRRALRELNRRNQTKARLTPTGAPIRWPDQNRRVTVPKDSSSEVRRFARHGGPDLCDLRGV